MIIEYDKKYNEEVKDLFVQLQEYIASIDKEGFNVLTPGFGDEYLKKTLKEMKKHNGKMFLLEENGKILGLIVGLVLEEMFEFGFHAPKRGEITELVVSKDSRGKGYGKVLLSAMEKYMKEQGCKNIIIGVFGYNDRAIAFYEHSGYHTRFIDMTKNI